MTGAVLIVVFAPPSDAAAPRLTQVGVGSSSSGGKSHVAVIPTRVRAGDRLVLFLSAATRKAVGKPAGWTQIEARNGKGLQARAWTRQATAADAGRRVAVRTRKAAKTVMAVVAYRTTGTGATVTTSSVGGSNAKRRSLTAPAVSLRDSGSWLVNMWSATSTKNPRLKLPSGVASRAVRSTPGKGRVSMAVGDSGRALAAGRAAGRRATTRKPVDRSAMFSVVVSPGRAVAPPNAAPRADFSSACEEQVCAFDASSSTDADGDPLTYKWTFGDGKNATGRQPEHDYTSIGAHTVTLTVSDGKATHSMSHQVVPGRVPAPTDSAAQPTTDHDGIVSDAADADMPRINDGEIWDIEVIDDTAYVVGGFTSVTDVAGDGSTLPLRNIVAYDLTTGLVDRDFDPEFAGGEDDNRVRAVEASPDGTKLYVAGAFNSIDGADKRKIASIDPATGAPVAGFTATANAQATALEATDTTVYAGGRFANINGTPRVGLAALDGTTGAVDTDFDNQLSGGIGTNGVLTVQTLKLTHDNSKLIVVHTARKIDGQDRYGVGIIGTTSKQLLPWRTRLWDDNLQYVGGIQRIYGGDIAPDDSYFVVTSGSGGDRPPINDTAIAFRFGGGDNRQPMWISRAFDSIYSVAITERAVYIGGHFQWNESPTAPDPWPGLDNVGYGTGQGLAAYALGDAVVRRDHLGALNPADGKALEWHPGSNSFEGNKAMLATPHGLLAGGDAGRQGGEAVGRVAFFDLDAPSTAATRITTPIQGRVVPAEQQFVIQGDARSGALQKVQVEIQAGSQFLAGDGTWSSSFTAIDAALGTTSAGRTAWSLPVTIPDAREITVRTKAFFTDGTTDAAKATKKIESFSFGDLPPTTRITGPSGSLQASTSFVLRGSASDDNGVSSVTLYVRDVDTDRYLNANGDLVDGYTTFRIDPDDPGAASTTWQHQLDLPYEGNWKIGAMASDNSGQSDTRWETREYTVDSSGQPPTVTVTQPIQVTPPVSSPTLTMAPGGPLTFRGTATDDQALATVEVSLRNSTTREGLAADGTWGSDVISGYHKISPAGLNRRRTAGATRCRRP